MQQQEVTKSLKDCGVDCEGVESWREFQARFSGKKMQVTTPDGKVKEVGYSMQDLSELWKSYKASHPEIEKRKEEKKNEDPLARKIKTKLEKFGTVMATGSRDKFSKTEMYVLVEVCLHKKSKKIARIVNEPRSEPLTWADLKDVDDFPKENRYEGPINKDTLIGKITKNIIVPENTNKKVLAESDYTHAIAVAKVYKYVK